MPIDYKLYPANWKELSRYLRFVRAGNRCEWCGAANYLPHPDTGSKVILTVAHLGAPKPDGAPGDKTDLADVRPENLAALCPRCHLNYDRADHLRAARRNRRRKLHEAGQQELQFD